MTHWRRALALGVALAPLMLTACAASASGGVTSRQHTGQATRTAAQRGAQPVSTTQSGVSSQPRAVGTISGAVVAGPTCPVESVDDPCPPRPVPDRAVSIQTPSGAEVAHTVTDAGGLFTVRLAAGAYVVRVAAGPGLFGMEQVTPGDVTVVAGQTTHIQIELDTGIR